MNNFGIYSLSATESEILLWSHYADQHKGFCLGFDGKAFGFENRTPIIEVDYQSKIPILSAIEIPANAILEINKANPNYTKHDVFKELKKREQEILTDRTSNLVLKALSTKYIYWSYEKEWRVFRRPGSALVKFNPRVLKTVTFGLKMLPEHKKTILNILSGPEWQHVELRQAIRSKVEFMIEAIPLKKEHVDEIIS